MNNMSLHGRISYHAENFPDRPAVECGSQTLSYRQLDEASNRIAAVLQGIRNKNVITLLERSPALISSLLGILKAGCVFVPIDPKYPRTRIGIMVNEVDAEWVISEKSCLDKLNSILAETGRKVNVLIVDTILENESYEFLKPYFPKNEKCDNPGINSGIANKHCYIYFTSGSTGKPKCVYGRHRSLLHFIEWEAKEFGIDETDRVSQITNQCFDPFLRDVFLPLYAGGTLCIPEEMEIVMHPGRLSEWMEKNGITLVHMVPSLFKMLNEAVRSPEQLKNLKYIMLAGEMLRGKDVEGFLEIFNNKIQLVNLYGPTETTLAKMFYRISREDVQRSSIPVGKPIDKTEVLILDSSMKKCQVGNPGEIYIRTPFISSGYFNDRELTGRVFIKNPFSDNPQDIIYKTGDMGRVLPDGNVEYLGRVDQQVKIRGCRIELGEIESRLLMNAAIKEATVIAKENSNGEKYLCAYTVSDEELKIKTIRECLSKELPDYMIPSYFVRLDKLPLTPNGKINRSALPDPNGSISTGEEYAAPTNETEGKLVRIWQEVLGVEKVGINDHFSDLGGHSLKAIRLEAEMEKNNMQINITDIFTYKTIKEMASYISGQTMNADIEINMKDISIYGKSPDNKESGIIKHKNANDQGYHGIYIGNFIPFNDIFYKSCFYNSLIPVIIYHNNDINQLLVNDVILYRYKADYDSMVKIDAAYWPLLDEEQILSDMGLTFNTKIISNNIIEDIKNSIHEQHPVIIWVDCFFATIRMDTYQKKHQMHTWLIYGFDDSNQVFYIIEHRKWDELSYEKREISYQDIIDSYNGYILNTQNSANIPSYFEICYKNSNDIYKENLIKKEQKNLVTFISNTLNNKDLICHNLDSIVQFADNFKYIVSNEVILKKNVEEMYRILTNIINIKKVERYRILRLFGRQPELYFLINEIVESWDTIRAKIGNYIYTSVYKYSKFMSACETLTGISGNERIFNEKLTDFLLERENLIQY